jgi:hypothetical protein
VENSSRYVRKTENDREVDKMDAQVLGMFGLVLLSVTMSTFRIAIRARA